MSYYYVFDAETGIHNRGEEAIGTFKASPFHPDNRIVMGGLKREGLSIIPVYHYGALPPPEDCVLLVGHNIGFDLHYLVKENPNWLEWLSTGRIWDTMLAEYLITGQQSKYASLDSLALKYGGTLKDDAIKKYWEDDVDTEDIPQSELQPYLKEDVNNTELVFLAQIEIAHEMGLIPLIKTQMEARLATWEMERNGMHFDKAGADKEKFALRCEEATLRNDIYHILKTKLPEGIVINPSSSQQLSVALFGGKIKTMVDRPVLDSDGKEVKYKTGARQGEVKTKKHTEVLSVAGIIPVFEAGDYSTKGANGYYSTDNAVLNKIVNNRTPWTRAVEAVELCELVLKLRELEKDIGTYYEGYSKLVWPTDDCIHPSYQHTATNTGRLSCTAPNLQNSSHS